MSVYGSTPNPALGSGSIPNRYVPSNVIRLRFASYTDFTSQLISTYEHFWATHVEAVMPDGSGYLGAVDDGGVQIRPVGYDKDTLVKEIFVDLPTTEEIAANFYSILKTHIGKPYDFGAILGFIVGNGLHQKGHAICSALQTAALEKSTYFHKLCMPPYMIDPADLLLMLSAMVNIPNAST